MSFGELRPRFRGVPKWAISHQQSRSEQQTYLFLAFPTLYSSTCLKAAYVAIPAILTAFCGRGTRGKMLRWRGGAEQRIRPDSVCHTLQQRSSNALNLAGIDFFCAVHTGFVLFCWKILFLSRGRTLIWNGMTSNALDGHSGCRNPESTEQNQRFRAKTFLH